MNQGNAELQTQIACESGPMAGASARFEMKYLVSQAKAEALTHYLEPLLTPDKFSQCQPGGYYPVSSLYLDTDDLKLCRESLDGKKNRFKLRVRAYCDAINSPRFLEIKRRMNAVIIKDRAQTSSAEVAALFGNDLSGFADLDDATRKQFQMYLRSIYAKPKVLIRYMRKAYLAGLDHSVRITLDKDLGYKQTTDPVVEMAGLGWQRVPLPGQILEIKFTGAYPGWVAEIVRRFGLQAQSVSKYTLGVRQASQWVNGTAAWRSFE